jgi:hypothetical protein
MPHRRAATKRTVAAEVAANGTMARAALDM